MANPYLIQAIYGPKPSVSNTGNSRDDAKPPSSTFSASHTNAKEDGTVRKQKTSRQLSQDPIAYDSAGNSGSSTLRPLSLAERLYSSAATPTSESRERRYPRRVNRMVSSGESSSITENQLCIALI
jgi:hypothetical protein